MTVGRIGADDHDEVGLRHRSEVLCAGRLPEGLLLGDSGTINLDSEGLVAKLTSYYFTDVA
ncbi:hypothetical protein, partial [Streptomyces sp. NPDC002547]